MEIKQSDNKKMWQEAGPARDASAREQNARVDRFEQEAASRGMTNTRTEASADLARIPRKL